MGAEDKGWDPAKESRAVIDDLYALMKMQSFMGALADPELTTWGLGPLFYSHIIEMSAPYEVLANLMRYKLVEGHHPNPFLDFLTQNERKNVQGSESPRNRRSGSFGSFRSWHGHLAGNS